MESFFIKVQKSFPKMEPHGQSPWYLHVLRRNPPKHTLLRTRLRRVILFAFIHGGRACTPECLPSPERFVQPGVSARRRGLLRRRIKLIENMDGLIGWPERAPQAPPRRRDQGAQYKMKLPCWEAPACGRGASICNFRHNVQECRFTRITKLNFLMYRTEPCFTIFTILSASKRDTIKLCRKYWRAQPDSNGRPADA